MSQAQFAGRAFVSVDGVRMRTKSGSKFDPGGVERTPVELDDGTVGYTEKTKASSIECTLPMAKDTDLVSLGRKIDSTVVFETDIGVSYVVHKAFVTSPPAFSGGDGDVSLKFAGSPAETL